MIAYSNKIADTLLVLAQQFPSVQKKGKVQYIAHEQFKVFGVRADEQKSLNFEQLKYRLFTQFDRPTDSKIVQAVGDSMKFSEQGVRMGLDFLNRHIDESRSLLLYGFNGRGNSKGCDLNQLVNLWVDAKPQRARLTCANVVEKTEKSLRDQDSAISTFVDQFFLVYGDGNTKTNYGDDMPLSDGLTDHLLTCDGGAQTFSQIVNCLEKGIPINGIYGLRGKNNPELLDKESNLFLSIFSASEFLSLLKQKVADSPQEISPEAILAFKEEYFRDHPPVNPSKSGYEKKMSILQKAWDTFFEKRLWTKLDNVTFTQAENL